jgi:hypothetical protein
MSPSQPEKMRQHGEISMKPWRGVAPADANLLFSTGCHSTPIQACSENLVLKIEKTGDEQTAGKQNGVHAPSHAPETFCIFYSSSSPK